MRFQRGPVMAYAAVVLIGLLVIIQTLSHDVSGLHRVPRTLSGQAEFTVIPPAPSPDVSGVSKIPSEPSDVGGREDDREEPERPAPPAEEKPDKAPPPSPPAAGPEAPQPSDEPTKPADPGEDEGGGEPPMLVPPVGPVPGIMAPLLWPFVDEKDAKPVDKAVPMFLRQLIAADAGVPVEALPLEEPRKEREKDEKVEETTEPAAKPDERESEVEKVTEGVCELTAAITEDVKKLPGMSEASRPGGRDATPRCDEACAEPKTPVGSSPAANPEVTTDSDEPSEVATADETEPVHEPKDGGTDDKTCAEKSVQ